VIGKGSPNKQGTHDVHGAALGDKEVAAVREYLGWTLPPFEMPADVYEAWDAKAAGAKQKAHGTACSPLMQKNSRKSRRTDTPYERRTASEF
jgi:transketolase